tara:strand:+ start:126 stop:308 length:183 start_codon:yes stop_codon:yes gene_type:complete
MNNKITLQCSSCYKEINVVHLDWDQILCMGCSKIKLRNEFLVKIKDYEILNKKIQEALEI